jgi:hypothetical protein
MTSTSTTRSKQKGSCLGFSLGIVTLLLAVAPSANANTYLFTFDVSDALAALQTSEGFSNFDKSGYFGLWVQPNPAAVTSYSYVVPGIVGPNTSNPDAWQATTITDYSSPNLGYSGGGGTCLSNCTWVQYSKQDGQTSAMVISGANSAQPAVNRGNIFNGAAYADDVPAPYGWGSTLATITSVYNGTNFDPTFQFVIDTPLTLSGPISVLGYASSLRSTSSTFFDTDPFFGAKEHDGIAFSLSITPAEIGSVPEPGTFGLLALGGIGFGLLRRLGQKRRPVSASTCDPASL